VLNHPADAGGDETVRRTAAGNRFDRDAERLTGSGQQITLVP